MLRITSQTKMWFIQVGVPYIRAKAQDYFEELGGGVDPEILEGSGPSRRVADDQVRSPIFPLFPSSWEVVIHRPMQKSLQSALSNCECCGGHLFPTL